MKIVKSLSAAFMAALITTACGGGGGGDSTPAPVVPVVVTVTCPNGSVVSNAANCPTVPVVTVTVTCPNGSVVASATSCPAVGTAPIALQGSVMSPVALDQGITIQFNGALVPSSVKIMLKQGDSILGSTLTIAGGDKDVTFKPNVRLAYGQAYTVMLTATDTLGRAVAVTLSFSTSAMLCSSNSVWSNPAVFSVVGQDCVAPVGVQALVTPSLNTMTDATCVPTVGVTLSASCRNYMANGTILIANTSVIVQNNPTVWFAYIGMDGKSYLVLLDTVTLAPIGTMVLSGPLTWLIGNPTGVNVDVTIGGLLRNEQITWNGASFTVACHSNC